MFTVAVLPGDGIGPEVLDETQKVLQTVTSRIEYITLPVGLESIKKYGTALTEESLETCKSVDAILFGAVGEKESHPEDSLGKIRHDLDLYANFRPIYFFSEQLCRVKDVKKFDILMVRELSSGIYFSERKERENTAFDVMGYTQQEIERVAHVAFKEAGKRRKKVTSVDKQNVLACSRLWRKTVAAVAAQYPVEVSHMFVDSFAMRLLVSPHEFDVVLTANLFGDILSDEAAVLSGSLGLMPSASYNVEKGYALFEPVHGSAPDLERGEANPVGAILSGALLLEYLGLQKEKDTVYQAVMSVLSGGCHTADLRGDPDYVVTTQEMGDLIAKAVA
jgi:3-isopropylmalate dehydrogenase